MTAEQSSSTLSEAGAQQLVQLLIKRGYMDKDASIISEIDSDSLEIFRKTKEIADSKYKGSQIIPTVDQSAYYSPSGLMQSIQKELEQHEGRLSQKDLGGSVGVDIKYLGGTDALPAGVQRIGNVFISGVYWDKLKVKLQLEVEDQGSIALRDLSSRESLSMDLLIKQCLGGLSDSSIITQNGSKHVVSDTYLKKLRETIVGTFQALEGPSLVATLCTEHGWDADLVIECLTEHSDRTGGDLHVDENVSTALFTPHTYEQGQRQAILDFVSANGYITASSSTRYGMPTSSMMEIVKKEFPDAIVLGGNDGCVVQDHVLQNVQVAIQESTTSVDLQEFLPVELLQPSIVRLVLDHIEFDPSQGVAVVADDQALVIHKDLVKEIAQKVLPPLVEAFAKSRAEELFKTAAPPAVEEEVIVRKSSKAKRKAKKATTVQSKTEETTSASRVVPLLQVAGALIKEFPDLMPEESEQQILEQADILSWDDGEENEILLVDFCKSALYTSKFQSDCEEAVRANLERLQSTKDSKATVSRKDAASKVRSVQNAFESSFATGCYMIQAMSKVIGLAANSEHFDEDAMETLKKEFLQGCCADLTSRMTQYCLFQNEEEGGIFTFAGEVDKEDDKEKEEDDAALPPYCTPVDTSISRYPLIHLSCPPPREPLPVLRESLSGNVGVSLARQWILCGGECYRGGAKTSDDDGSTFIKPGNMESFLSHVEKNCL
jgi:hypothetical protein